MAHSNRSSSDLSDIDSLWNPPSAIQLSYKAVVTGNDLKGLKLGIIGLLEKYGLSDGLDIENVLTTPFVDQSISYLPSQFGYALLISGTDQHANQIKGFEACLCHFGLEVTTVAGPSRNQFIGHLIRLVFYAAFHVSHVPVIVGYCGRIHGLMLKLSDGDLDLHLVIDLLLLLPSKDIIIPVIEGFDHDARLGFQNEFSTKLKQLNRPFILYHAFKSDGPSIFTHLSKELKMSSDLKVIIEQCNSCPTATIASAPAIEDINLSSMRSEEPAMPACGCGNCSVFDVCAGKCSNPHKSKLVAVLYIPDNAQTFVHNCTREETQKLIRTAYALLESEFCRGLQAIDHSRLVLVIRNFFPRFKEMNLAENDMSSGTNDFIYRFYQYLIKEAAWISNENLDQLKKLAEDLGRCDLFDSLNRMESCVKRLTDIQRLEQSSRICYPSHCHHTRMEHYVFGVDEGFALLPFSAFYSLHHLVLEKIRQHRQTHVFVSFATCRSMSLKQ